MTLLESGSPDATPSGYRSRRSCQPVVDARAEPPHASEAPIAAASRTNSRRVSVIVCPFPISPHARQRDRAPASRRNHSCGCPPHGRAIDERDACRDERWFQPFERRLLSTRAPPALVFETAEVGEGAEKSTPRRHRVTE